MHVDKFELCAAKLGKKKPTGRLSHRFFERDLQPIANLRPRGGTCEQSVVAAVGWTEKIAPDRIIPVSWARHHSSPRASGSTFHVPTILGSSSCFFEMSQICFAEMWMGGTLAAA